jgi:hypothetical protein
MRVDFHQPTADSSILFINPLLDQISHLTVEAPSFVGFRLLDLSLIDSVHFCQENVVLPVDFVESFWVRRSYLFGVALVWVLSRRS